MRELSYKKDELLVITDREEDIARIEEVLSRYDAEVIGRLTDKTFHLRVNPSSLESLRMELVHVHEFAVHVQYVMEYQLQYITPPAAGPNDPYESRQAEYYREMNLYPALEISSGSPSVTVAVCDTAGTLTNHLDLVDNALPGVDLSHTSVLDKFGHGTAVAGCIAATMNNAKGVFGPSPLTKVLPIKPMGADEGTTTTAALVETLYKAIELKAANNIRVLNLSWGSVAYPPSVVHLGGNTFRVQGYYYSDYTSPYDVGDLHVFWRRYERRSDHRGRLYGRVVSVTGGEPDPKNLNKYLTWDCTVEWLDQTVADLYDLDSIDVTGWVDAVYDAAVTAVWNAGIVPVIAAGNEGQDYLAMPAMCQKAVAVGTSTPGGLYSKKAGYSNWGTWVDIYAASTVRGTFYSTTTVADCTMLPIMRTAVTLDQLFTFTGDVYKDANGRGFIRIFSSMDGIERKHPIQIIAGPSPYNMPPEGLIIEDFWSGNEVTTNIAPIVAASGITFQFKKVVSGQYTAGSNVITNLNFTPSPSLVLGMSVVSQYLPDYTTLTGYNAAAKTITLSQNASYSSSGIDKIYINSSRVYSEIAGTSFATPTAAALFASLFAINPDLTPQQALDIVMGTCKLVTNAGLAPGYSLVWTEYYRQIDFYKAMQAAWATKAPPAASLTGLDQLVTANTTYSTLTLAWGAPTTTVTPEPGGYPESHFVTLSMDEPGMIFYTTDSTDPAQIGRVPQGSTQIYTAPIEVGDTEIRYFAIDEADNAEPIKSAFYVLGEVLIGTFDLVTVIISPSVTTPVISGGVVGFPARTVSIRPSVMPAVISGVRTGSFTSATVTVRPSVAPAVISGGVPTTGTFTLVTATVRPSILAPSLSGITTLSGTFSTSTVTATPYVTPPFMVGLAASINTIRAPSGRFLDLRKIDGTPLYYNQL